jgi:hypothetical protein
MQKKPVYHAADISLNEFRNKLYIDPGYGTEQFSSVINYAVFKNKWNIEDIKENYSIKIVHPGSGDSIILSFNSFKDKVAFSQNIFSSSYIKQTGTGHDLESLANLNLLYAEKNGREENILITIYDLLKHITSERILRRINSEKIFKRISALFKKRQFAN